MGKRYGSKAAYEASKAASRAARAEWEKELNMTDAERAKQRNLERLEGDEGMMTHMILMAASLAGGEKPNAADKAAASCIELLKGRFT